MHSLWNQLSLGSTQLCSSRFGLEIRPERRKSRHRILLADMPEAKEPWCAMVHPAVLARPGLNVPFTAYGHRAVRKPSKPELWCEALPRALL